jgi:hypothetical protein
MFYHPSSIKIAGIHVYDNMNCDILFEQLDAKGQNSQIQYRLRFDQNGQNSNKKVVLKEEYTGIFIRDNTYRMGVSTDRINAVLRVDPKIMH